MGPEADVVRPRFARGCRCFGVMIDGAIAGYGWLSNGPEWISELQVEIRPRKGEGYIWNCVTLPQHRQQGVFKALIGGISAAARGLGFTRLWIGTVAIPGEGAIPQLGFRPLARFRTVRLLGMFFTSSSMSPEARHVLPNRARLHGGTLTRRKH